MSAPAARVLVVEDQALVREHILQVLEDTAGNQVRAAEVLGIDRRTLHRKLKEYRGSAA